MLESAWSIFDVLELNFGDDGYDAREMQRFVVSLDSQFYLDFGRLYRRRIDAWAAAHHVDAEEEDTDGDSRQCLPKVDVQCS